MWVYIKSEANLYTVGFYGPRGEWHTDSDHETRDAAAERAHYLNGRVQEEKKATAAPPAEEEPRSECQNCRTVWADADLEPVKDLFARVSPGEPMPSGECPDCHAVCHPVDAQDGTFNRLIMAIEFCNTEEGAYCRKTKAGMRRRLRAIGQKVHEVLSTC